MEIYKCDRCSKHFEERPLNLEINDRRAIYPQTIKSVDLCDECFKSFNEWLGIPYEVPIFPECNARPPLKDYARSAWEYVCKTPESNNKCEKEG